MTHPCPRDGCTEELPDSVVTCNEHWSELPKSFQNRLMLNWSPKGRPDGARGERFDRALSAAQTWWALLDDNSQRELKQRGKDDEREA